MAHHAHHAHQLRPPPPTHAPGASVLLRSLWPAQRCRCRCQRPRIGQHEHAAARSWHWQAKAGAAPAAAATPAQPRAAARPARSAGDDGARSAARQQSLEVLEWPSVCRQVAAFCGTSVAAEALLAGALPIGSSAAESELLLQQTAEAAAAGLAVSGVFDLRPALEAAAGGGILNARQLEGVAASLEAAFELRGSTCQPAAGERGEQQQPRYPCLAALAAGIQPAQRATLAALRACISDGAVLSDASPELAAVRSARAANKDAARAAVSAIARQLHTQGAAEGREPLLLRGRYCVAVKRSSRSALSKGSVRLGASGTGATLYIEPAELMDLNNREAQLADQEAQAELHVQQALSQLLGEQEAALMGLLASVAQLDVVAARARHAAWCGGQRPRFTDADDGSAAGGDGGSASPLSLPGALHPLLLAAALPPLPRPPSADDASFETDFVAPPLFAAAAAAAAASRSSDSDSDTDSDAAGAGDGAAAQQHGARPLDLRVPAAARVVAVTGPNTGGKTVTLKTAGLLALMAKAGLFLPLARADSAGGAAAAAAAADGQAMTPSLLWFDQVLADIGDSQSLQQNLSTFSGHIARLKRVLAAAGPRSLVLLDEVGSGTDPQEGAALARAVLDVLAGQARLTLASSHHAELKAAAEQDARYVNVSLEFDTATLRPTYRLLWGCAGASNALDIAQALGFDATVLAEARALVAAEAGRAQQERGRMEQVAASVEAQLAATRASLDAATEARQAREAEAELLESRHRELLALRHKVKSRQALVKREAAEFVLRVQAAASRARRGEGRLEDVAAVVDSYVAAAGSSGGSSGSGSQSVCVGDMVVVPRLGVANPFKARVLKVSGEHVWLEGGANPLLQRRSKNAGRLQFRLDEVVPEAQLAPLPGPDGGALGQLAGESPADVREEARLMASVDEALEG